MLFGWALVKTNDIGKVLAKLITVNHKKYVDGEQMMLKQKTLGGKGFC